LKDKGITQLSASLQACLEYEEQAMRTGLPLNDPSKNHDMSAFLQLMQDINNRMISFEQRVPPLLYFNNSPLLQSPIQQSVNQTHTLMTRPFCNFCEEHHDPKTCEVLKTTKEHVFGKRLDLTINALYWMDDKYVLAVTTRSQSQRNPEYNQNLNFKNQSVTNNDIIYLIMRNPGKFFITMKVCKHF